MLPKTLGAQVDEAAITAPAISELLSSQVEKSEMRRTFNCGVGMVLVVPKQNVDKVLRASDGYIIGEIVEGSGVSYC